MKEPWVHTLRCAAELSKPVITLTSVMMALGGLALASQDLTLHALIAVFVGVGGTVAAANAINMVMEGESDARMKRTRNRPIPTGRMSGTQAFWVGVFYAAAGLASLVLFANWLSAALGLAALLIYVAIYTPLKLRTPWALAIGAVPGAAPALMGWTIATGSADAAGIAIFALLFFWQIPHFIGISVWRRDDYIAAGMPTYGVVKNARAAQREAIAYASALIPSSLALVWLGQATWFFGTLTALLGAWMVWVALRRHTDWSRQLFIASLAYLPALILVLAIDRLVFI